MLVPWPLGGGGISEFSLPLKAGTAEEIKNQTMLKEIQQELASTNTTLVAVSKTKPAERILAMYQQGQKIFGENKVQEVVEKQALLPKDIEWHLIGHLQSNKVKYIAPFIAMIHSVENEKLLATINRQAAKNNRIIPCLLQFKIAQEATKFGLDLATAKTILASEDFKKMENIRIEGVMGMASFTRNEVQVQAEFKRLKEIFDELQQMYFMDQPAFKEISMGMSGDYQVAIAEGSTMVRIGSLLFGNR